jgi:hypothetical protein
MYKYIYITGVGAGVGTGVGAGVGACNNKAFIHKRHQSGGCMDNIKLFGVGE